MIRIRILVILFIISFQGYSQWSRTNGPEGGRIFSLQADSTRYFAGSSNGLWIADIREGLWRQANGGIPQAKILALMVSGSSVWAGTGDSGVYRSANGGTAWVQANTGLTNHIVKALLVSQPTLFAGTGGGLFSSADGGDHWSAIGGSIAGRNITVLADAGSLLTAGTYGDGIFISNDHGVSWQKRNSGLPDLFILALASGNNMLFAGTEGGKVFGSSDNGNSWQVASNGLPLAMPVNSLTFSGPALYAGTGGQGVYRSTDNGQSWTAVNSFLANTIINSVSVAGNAILAGTGGGGAYLSYDQGDSWLPMNNGLIASNVKVQAGKGTSLMAGTDGAGFFVSGDNGHNWASRSNNMSNLFISAILPIGNKIIAGTSGGGAYITDNIGGNWTPAGNGLANPYISSLCSSGSYLFAGSSGSGVFVSADTGVTWSAASSGITDPVVTSLAVCSQKIYAGTQNSGVFASSDLGDSWTKVNTGLTNQSVTMMAGQGDILFAGTPGGLFRLVLPAAVWIPVLCNSKSIAANTIAFFGNSVIAGTEGAGVLLSDDSGNTWTSLNKGLPDSTINSFMVSGLNLFAGVGEKGIWVRQMNDLFPNKVVPDTAILRQTIGFQDTLYMQSGVDWSIQGTIPPWFSISKLTGNGSDTIIVRALQDNQGYLARYSTLYVFSSVASTTSFTVMQTGKNFATDDHNNAGDIRIIADDAHETLNISAGSEMKNIILCSIDGRIITNLAVDSKSARLNIKSVPGGTFILQISGDGWSSTAKIVL